MSQANPTKPVQLMESPSEGGTVFEVRYFPEGQWLTATREEFQGYLATKRYLKKANTPDDLAIYDLMEEGQEYPNNNMERLVVGCDTADGSDSTTTTVMKVKEDGTAEVLSAWPETIEQAVEAFEERIDMNKPSMTRKEFEEAVLNKPCPYCFGGMRSDGIGLTQSCDVCKGTGELNNKL